MEKNNIVVFLILLCCVNFGCTQQDKSKYIEVKYVNWSIESLVSPKLEDVLDGLNSEFLVSTTIKKRTIYDSIVKQIKILQPMKKEVIPDYFGMQIQCIIHYANAPSDTLLIGYQRIISLNKVVMQDDDTLVELIKRHSRYYHPHAGAGL